MAEVGGFLGRALRREGAVSSESWPERADGQLVWLHVARPERLQAVLQLGQRLRALRDTVNILITAPAEIAGPRRLKPGVMWCQLPNQTRSASAAFLAHFRPDVCVWTSGDLHSDVLQMAAQTDVPMILVDAIDTGFGEVGLRGWRNPAKAALPLFAAIFAADALAAARVIRLGATEDVVEVTGPLQEGSAALPYRASDLEELSEAIGPRPVWLAAMVQPEEVTTVLRAHRNATRFSHRLLLVLVPDHPDMADDMAERARRENLRVARWSEGDFPDDMTEVLLGDTMGEMGLWYRVASVSFMASSLIAGKGGCDPFEPAALGSAILYGPNCGRHLQAYSRLVDAGAARMVRDTDSLTGALKTLAGPDRAAQMALAAWTVVSEGALVADKVTDLVQDILDLREAG
ncbi:3-deoxy-D-manno-octulosonic acid transferase [Roseobacteraceae bacterium S113]